MSFFTNVKNYLAKSLARKIIAIVLCVVVLGGAATGIILGVSSCGGDKHTVYNNEEDPLRFSTLEVDGVFNPFFSTSGTDSSVVGMTQLSLLSNDEEGKVVCGDDEETIAKELKIVHEKDASGEITKTTYYFVLKNNVKFSNGTNLTMKDVLFNFYVYLDPVYAGSSTMYSTDIVGLKEYRTQQTDANAQENFMKVFQDEAYARRLAFVEAYADIKKALGGTISSEAQLKKELAEYTANNDNEEHTYANLVKDYERIIKYFDEELESDYTTATGGYADLKFYIKEKDGSKTESTQKLNTDAEVFLYNEGIIEYLNDPKEDRFICQVGDIDNIRNRLASMSKEEAKKEAISYVKEYWIPSRVDQVAQYWSSTSSKFITYLTNAQLSKYYSDSANREIKSIKGIQFVNMDKDFTITDDDGNTVTYKKPVYHDNTERDYVVEGNEVLSITINKVDPKAVWNFGIGIAPMYYYSNAEQVAKFDYKENFGVDYGNSDFFDDVLKNSDKNGVPVGAGAYAAANSAGGLLKTATNTTYKADDVKNDVGQFRKQGVIYYERNPYYDMAKNDQTKTAPDGNEYHVAKIKKVRYVVMNTNIMEDSLRSQVDFIEPNAKLDVKNSLVNKGFGATSVATNGYGYIGINAGKVPSVYVRRAIMHAMDTQECVKYYGSMAQSIARPISRESWAYPKDTIAYYPYIAGTVPKELLEKNSKGGYKYVVYEEYRNYVLDRISKGEFTESDVKAGKAKLSDASQQEYLKRLVEKGGYTIGDKGIYAKNNGGKSDELKYTFTVAGETDDHPAYQTMAHAKQILDKLGMSITVKNDKDALLLLASGGLTVWAAAWGSTIDPDMYQVYHKDSKATSVLNWGYREILNDTTGKYAAEKDIIVNLSDVIDGARQREDENYRREKYKTALDLIMELAVELPTYQRQDLFGYDQNKIDVSTFYTPAKPFKGLTSNLTSMSLIEK